MYLHTFTLVFVVLWKFLFLSYKVLTKSSDYSNVLSAKLEYLNSYEHIFNSMLFVISLEESILCLGKTCLCITAKKSNLKRNKGRYLNTFRLLCFILTYSKAIIHYCYSFNHQSSIFWEYESFIRLPSWIVTNSWLCHFQTGREHQKLGKSNSVY